MKILIAIPCMDMLPVPFVASLDGLIPVGECAKFYECSSLIYDSRNNLARKAVKEGYDAIFWLDSDMVFEPDTLVDLARTMEEEGADLVTGLCFSRRYPNYRPTIFSELCYRLDIDSGKMDAIAETMYEYPKDAAFRIAGCGMACCLMKTVMVDEITREKGLPFAPLPGFGEDLSFCKKAADLGYKLVCDSRVKVGHIGTVIVDERTYEAMRRNDGTD